MNTPRYTLQPSENEGFWMGRDNESGLTIEFRENDFNESQNATYNEDLTIDDSTAQRVARNMREIGEWLNVNYPHLVFTADELKTMLVNVCVSRIAKIKEAQGEEVDLYMGEYTEFFSTEDGEVMQQMFEKLEKMLSPDEYDEFLDRIEFLCDIENRDIRHAVGDRIKILREAANLTQVELAKLAGISRSNMVNIEAGKYSVGIDIVHRIASALGREVYIL